MLKNAQILLFAAVIVFFALQIDLDLKAGGEKEVNIFSEQL